MILITKSQLLKLFFNQEEKAIENWKSPYKSFDNQSFKIFTIGY